MDTKKQTKASNNKRIGMQEIAEILINNIELFESTSKTIKQSTEQATKELNRVSSQKLDINLTGLQYELKKLKDHNESQRELIKGDFKTFLSDLNKYNNIQTSRIPNYLTGLVFGVVLMCVVSSVYFGYNFFKLEQEFEKVEQERNNYKGVLINMPEKVRKKYIDHYNSKQNKK